MNFKKSLIASIIFLGFHIHAQPGGWRQELFGGVTVNYRLITPAGRLIDDSGITDQTVLTRNADEAILGVSLISRSYLLVGDRGSRLETGTDPLGIIPGCLSRDERCRSIEPGVVIVIKKLDPDLVADMYDYFNEAKTGGQFSCDGVGLPGWSCFHSASRTLEAGVGVSINSMWPDQSPGSALLRLFKYGLKDRYGKAVDYEVFLVRSTDTNVSLAKSINTIRWSDCVFITGLPAQSLILGLFSGGWAVVLGPGIYFYSYLRQKILSFVRRPKEASRLR